MMMAMDQVTSERLLGLSCKRLLVTLGQLHDISNMLYINNRLGKVELPISLANLCQLATCFIKLIRRTARLQGKAALLRE
jgi:hypothetical protein